MNSTYLDRFKAENPGVEKYTDDEILSILPEMDSSLKGMSQDELVTFATTSEPSSLWDIAKSGYHNVMGAFNLDSAADELNRLDNPDLVQNKDFVLRGPNTLYANEHKALTEEQILAKAQRELETSAEHYEKAGDVTLSPTTQKFLSGSDENSSWLDDFLADPVTIVSEIGAQSAYGSALSMSTGAATGMAMGPLAPLGLAAGSGYQSGRIEFANTVAKELRDSGVDITDANALRQALTERPELYKNATDKAMKRGAAIGTFDAATMGLASKSLGVGQGLTKQATNMLAQGAVQTGGGAAGEAVAQLVTDGEITDGRAIAAEAVGELVTAPVDVVIAAKGIRATKPDEILDHNTVTEQDLDQSESFREAYWEIADKNPNGDVSEMRQQAREAVADKLLLPHDGTIYRPFEPSEKQAQIQENTRSAYEGQHGTAQNTGLDGEFLGPDPLPETLQPEGNIFEGELHQDPAQIENLGTPGIPHSGIIFGEGPVAQPKPEDGMTAAYEGPKQSRKAVSRQEPEASMAPAPIAKGKRDKAFTPDNQAIDVSYSVIDLADMRISHDESGGVNPNYPQEMQPRDRRNRASQLQIRKLAAGLQPERLAESANVGDGAPIIGPDGVVESGNGRAAAIRLAYQLQGPQAKAYKQFTQQRARELGVPAEQLLKMSQPVLVRTRETDVNRAEFARRANKPQLSTMNEFEQAISDAQYIDLDMLRRWSPSETDGALSASNREFIKSFGQALGDNELAGLITNDGRATAKFGQRMQAAIFAKAYDNPRLVEMLTDGADSFRNIIGGLRDAAPDFALAKEINPDAGTEVINQISESISLLDKGRQTGLTVKELLSQKDAFTGEVSPETKTLAQFMSVSRVRPKRISAMLKSLGQMVRQEAEYSQTQSMFGDDTVNNQELINESINRSEEIHAQQQEQGHAVQGMATSKHRGTERGQAPSSAEGTHAEVISEQDLNQDSFELTTHTEADLATQQAQHDQQQAQTKQQEQAFDERQQADRELNDFTLTGSDSTVDQTEARGQNNLFAGNPSSSVDQAIAAIRKVIATHQDVPNAVYRDDLGYIDFIWGAEGKPPTKSGKRKGAKGVAHLLEARIRKDSKSPEEAIKIADEVAKVVQTGKIIEDHKHGDMRQVTVSDYEHSAVLVKRESENAWLLTGWEDHKDSDETGKGDDNTSPTHSKPTPSRPEVGAKSSNEIIDPNPSGNKVFTDDMADKAREVLRKKLGQLNSGLDPEMLQAGIVLAGYHIEKGARKFNAFAKAMMNDMGNEVRPYLKQFYLAAKMDPRMPQDVVADMDKAGTVEDFDVTTLTGNTDDSNATERASGHGQDGTHAEPTTKSDLRTNGPDEINRDAGRTDIQSGTGVPGSGSRLGNSRTSDVRERSGQQSTAADAGNESGTTGDTDGGRSRSDSTGGMLAGRNRVEPVKSAPKQAPSRVIPANLKLENRSGDLKQIKLQMPYLAQGQAEDVVFAENRFAKPDGFGVLFTNGTGTGKTFTGLGVVFRHWHSGKKNILITAPSQAIINSWVKAAKDFFGLNVNVLQDTRDHGDGIVATTFANLGSNNALVKRNWDLVVLDEAHYLSQDQQGSATKSLKKINALAEKPGTAIDRTSALYPETYAKAKEISNEINALSKDRENDNANRIKKLQARLDPISKKLREVEQKEAKRLESIPDAERTRGLFLSATPFPYVLNTRWGNGWLFDWGSDNHGLGYNSGDNQQQFFMEHFGYSMRYNKLNRPGPEVDTGIMERQFNSWLKKEGVLSSRKLDSDFDYDRKFILTETALGHRIDEALSWIRDKSGSGEDAIPGMSELSQQIDKAFDYHTRIYLLEALKAQEAVPYISQNLELGRNVVVMHDRKQGGVKSPFIMNFSPAQPEYQAYQAFRAKFSDLIDGFGYLPPVIDILKSHFPDAMVYNGDVSAKERIKIQDQFNDDSDNARLIIAQGDAMREGVSIHDTTGKHQRVLLHLGLPVKPVSSIQQEGRIYRVGQASDALFRYFTIGTNWERWAFASTIAQRSSTAENLAMGEEARGLKQAFIQAYEEADINTPHKGEGKGGKASDSALTSTLTPWDSAKSFYFGTKKQGKGRSAKGREQSEFFATPEPVGLKMVELADIQSEDKVLEPSAGHGAIARWFPENATKKAIEMTNELSSKLALRFEGEVITGRFEDHNIVNKYDAIVMNPPFGHGGKLAADHVAKALKHLRNGGRVVALIPTGPAADKQFDKLLFDNEETKDIHLAAEIQMPSVTFERAGTGVRTRIIVLEKQTDSDKAARIQQQNRDYSSVETIGDLFDRMEDLTISPRQKKPAQPVQEATVSPADSDKHWSEGSIIEHETKRGKILKGVVAPLSKEEAKEIDPYTFKKDGGYFIRQTRLAELNNSNEVLMSLASVVKGGPKPKGMPVDEVKQIADEFLADYKGNIPLKAVIRKTQEDLYGPEATIEQHGVLKGGYLPASGVFTLAADNLSDRADTERTILHEVIGHFGLNTLLPSDKRRLLEKILESKGDHSLKSVWEKVSADYSDRSPLYQAEEVFAAIAELPHNNVKAFSTEILYMLSKALRKVGLLKSPVTYPELRALALRIAHGIKDGTVKQQTFPKTNDAQFSVSHQEQGQVFEATYPDGMTVDQVKTATQSLGKIAQRPEINILQTAQELPMVVRLRNMMQGIPDWANLGVWHNGQIYIVAENLYSDQQAIDVMVHEVVGHGGIRGLVGNDLTPMMLQIYESFKGSPTMANVRENYPHYDPENKEHRQYLAEELLAHAAEYQERPTLVKRAIAKIRQLLRKVFPGIQWTANDIYALLDSARRFVERQNNILAGSDNKANDVQLHRMRSKADADVFGDFDPAQKTVWNKISPLTTRQRAGHWLKEKMDRAGLKLRQGMVDRYASLMELDKKRFGDSAFEENITSSSFVLARMAANASGAVSALMQHGRIYWDANEKVIDVDENTAGKGGLTGVLYQLGSAAEIERFMAWIAGNRSEKLAAEGRENLFTTEDINALKTMNTGTTADGRNRQELYDNVFEEFQKYRDDVLKIAEQAGIISAENRSMWKDEFYVPFYRVAQEDQEIQGPMSKKGLSRQEAYKKLKGGKQELNDLLENTIMNFHHLLDASLKNIAATQAIDSAVELNAASQTTEAAKDKNNSTFILREGKRIWYNVHDPLLFNSLTTLSSPAMNGTAMKVMRFAKRIFTQATTITPQFQVANLIRDSIQAVATSKMPYNPAANAAKGMAAYGVWNKESLTRARMMASGGSMSFGHIYGGDPEAVKLEVNKQLKGSKLLKQSNAGQILKGVWNKWNDVNDSFENASRAAIFEHNYRKGNKLNAAWEARDLIDFSAHGAWPAIRFLIDTVPFLNARIQGLDKLYRSGVKPTAKVIRETFGGPGASASDKLAAKRFSIVTGALAMATMALYLANRDDEEYQKLEEWQKDTYWFFRAGDHAVFIPKPFEVGAIATFSERLLEQAVDDKATGKLFAERMWHMLSDTFSFNPTPQLFMPALEVFANHNTFTDRPIESAGLSKLSPSLRVKASTSEFSQGTSKVLESVFGQHAFSPLQIDHMIQGYFGQIGAMALGTGNVIYGVATGKETPDRSWPEYQPMRRFYRDLSVPGYTKYETLFYDRLQEVRTVYSDIKKLREMGELEQAVELAQEKRSDLAMRTAMNRVARKLAQLNTRSRIIRASNWTAEKKRRELDRVKLLKNRLTQITMERLAPAA